jgi:hypothetical protein
MDEYWFERYCSALIFIRGVDENFKIQEELAGLCSMVGHTTRKEIVNGVNKFGLHFKNLVAIFH